MLGPHVHTTGYASPLDAIKFNKGVMNKHGLKMGAAQMHLAGPQSRKLNYSPEKRQAIKRYITDNNIRLVVHGTNMDAPWSGQPHAAMFIREEIAACEEAGACGIVIHMNTTPVDTIVSILPTILDTSKDVKVYLENHPSNKVHGIQDDPIALSQLFAKIKALGEPIASHVGLCIDTAHLWSSGAHIQTDEDAAPWVDGLWKHVLPLLPKDGLMFHLNDNWNACGGGKDRHASLGYGNLWGDGVELQFSGAEQILSFAAEEKCMVILERNAPHKSSVAVAKQVVLDQLASDYNYIFGSGEGSYRLSVADR